MIPSYVSNVYRLLEIVSYPEYGKVINRAFNDLVGGVSDKAVRAELLRPMMEYAALVDSGKEELHTLKSIVARMQSAKDQFTGLVRAFVQPMFQTNCLIW
jgi:hypothetical protein